MGEKLRKVSPTTLLGDPPAEQEIRSYSRVLVLGGHFPISSAQATGRPDGPEVITVTVDYPVAPTGAVTAVPLGYYIPDRVRPTIYHRIARQREQGYTVNAPRAAGSTASAAQKEGLFGGVFVQSGDGAACLRP